MRAPIPTMLAAAALLSGCAIGPTHPELRANLDQTYQACLKLTDNTLIAACVQTVLVDIEREQLALEENAAPDPLASTPPTPTFTPAPVMPTPSAPPAGPPPDWSSLAIAPPVAQPMPRIVPLVPGPETGAAGGDCSRHRGGWTIPHCLPVFGVAAFWKSLRGPVSDENPPKWAPAMASR